MGHRSAIEIEDMDRDEYDKAMKQVWAPTMDLRFVFRAVALGDSPPKVRILQQRWIDQLGTSEWRDVPLVDPEDDHTVPVWKR